MVDNIKKFDGAPILLGFGISSPQHVADAIAAGASGAIFGVAGGLFAVVIANRGRIRDLNVRQVGLMVILSLYLGFRSAETDNLAHVAGAVIGFILAALFYCRPLQGNQ